MEIPAAVPGAEIWLQLFRRQMAEFRDKHDLEIIT
jgi:hypothetical protein